MKRRGIRNLFFGGENDNIKGGRVAEWLKAHDSKSCMRQRIAGSNPVSSAIS